MDYLDYITSNHSLYDRYYDDWKLQLNSWYGSTEYKQARYLRAYASDTNTPSETINSFVVNDDGSVVNKVRAKLENVSSSRQADTGSDLIEDGTFYGEKLSNTPLYNYVKLIVAEYNSILFRNPPQRILPNTPETEEFIKDVDGEGQSLNEFMGLVDMYTTIFGVCHVGCYKPLGSDIPKWRIHLPTDVTNWSYRYDIDGNLKLTSIVIKVDVCEDHIVYRHITEDTMETVWVGADDDFSAPVDDPMLEDMGDGSYRITQENELGYIPVKTIYQSTKVYNNVGTTIIGDVAQIQRSIYGDMAEIYSAIAFGSHPTLVVDETTDQLNDGQIGAEPGSVIRVQSSLTGEQNYTYEFVAPQLDAITQIRELVDSKINKLTQISMIRSEDIIRTATSGEQIEVFDDKLSSLIRRKATNLENTEFGLWKMWMDWLNMTMPEDFRISYSRHYNKRALSHEIAEIEQIMTTYTKYKETFGSGAQPSESYATQAEAESRAQQLGGSGFHTHVEDGVTQFMPFRTHGEYEAALVGDPETQTYEEDLRDKLRQRLSELLDSSSTSNSL